MSYPSVRKDPSAELPYGFDWSDWLGEDLIQTSTWIVPAGLTQPKPPSKDNTTTTVWLGGGDVGSCYTVTNEITTAGDRTDQRSFRVIITER